MTLFLILWFADICDSLATTTVVLVFITIAVIICYICFLAIANDTHSDITEDTVKIVTKTLKLYMVIALSIISIGILLPTSKTIYITTGIAAIQEATKTVAESDTAKKAVELLNIKLDDYLKEAKKDK